MHKDMLMVIGPCTNRRPGSLEFLNDVGKEKYSIEQSFYMYNHINPRRPCHSDLMVNQFSC